MITKIHENAVSLWQIENNSNMGGSNQDWGKKGGCVGRGMLFLALFIIMLIWIYWKNQNGVPQ